MIMFCVKQACLGGVLLFGVLLMMCSGGGSRPAAATLQSIATQVKVRGMFK